MRERETAVDGDPTEAEFEQIVKVCDGFEAQWRRGERPRIEVFLARNPSLPRPALFRELLALELELARAEGSAPTADEYRARFSEWLVMDSRGEKSLLDDLLIRCEELNDQGRPVTIEDLCVEHPELVKELRRRDEALPR